MRISLIFFLFLANLSLQAQRFKLSGKVKSFKEGQWIYLSYFVQGKRVLDSTEVKGGRFQFSNKLEFPVQASLFDNDHRFYNGDNRFSFILEPAKFSIYSDDNLNTSKIKNSRLNEESQELLRRIISFSFSMQRSKVIQQYPEYRRPGEQIISLSKNAEERQKQESTLTDSVCIAFAKAYPKSYESARVLANVMSWNQTDSAIYKQAKSVFNRCPNRWKNAPLIKETLAHKLPRPRFVMGELSFD